MSELRELIEKAQEYKNKGAISSWLSTMKDAVECAAKENITRAITLSEEIAEHHKKIGKSSLWVEWKIKEMNFCDDDKKYFKAANICEEIAEHYKKIGKSSLWIEWKIKELAFSEDDNYKRCYKISMEISQYYNVHGKQSKGKEWEVKASKYNI